MEDFDFSSRKFRHVDLTKVISEAFDMSKSEARRKIKENAIKIDGVKLIDHDWFLEGDTSCCFGDLDGKVLQFGKRKFVRIEWKNE